MAPHAVESSRRLTGPERALWELQRRAPHCGAWNQAVAFHVLGGQLTIPALTAALDLLTRRHPALRTRYPERAGEPARVTVSPGDVALDIPVRGPGHGLWPDELRIAAGRPFDLARDLPVRVTVLRFRGVDTLVLSAHRLVCDPWTVGLIYQELAAGYGAFATGAPVPPELAGTAEGHVEPPPSARVTEYWRDRLADSDPAQAALAVGRGDPPTPMFTGGLLAQPLGPPAHHAVPTLARQLRVNEDVALLTAYFALLAYHGGGPDLVVGVRVEPVAEPTRIGYRTGILPIHVRVDLSESFASLATRVQDRLLAAVAQQPGPPEARPLGPVAGTGTPAVRYTFRFSRQPPYGWFGDLPTRPAPVDTGHSWYDLAMDVDAEPARTGVRMAYRSEIFDEDDVRALLQRYDVLLCQAMATPEHQLAELSWWTSADRAVVAGARRFGTGATVQDAYGRPLPPGVRGTLPRDGMNAGLAARLGYDGRIERLATSPRREAGRLAS